MASTPKARWKLGLAQRLNETESVGQWQDTGQELALRGLADRRERRSGGDNGGEWGLRCAGSGKRLGGRRPLCPFQYSKGREAGRFGVCRFSVTFGLM